jgi:hypothetical protein
VVSGGRWQGRRTLDEPVGPGPSAREARGREASGERAAGGDGTPRRAGREKE